MKIGIDLDGVCYDFTFSLAKYLQREDVLGPVALPAPTRWEFYEDWGLTEEQFVGHCYLGAKAGIVWRYGEPIEDAANQLRRLMDAGHTVVITTDRDFGEAARANTREWLYENDVPHDELIFTAKKGEVDIDYLIDDRAENYEEARNAGINAYLLNRPWNIHYPGGYRVGSLQAFVDIVIAAGVKAEKIAANPFMCGKCNDYIDSPVHFYACEGLQVETANKAPDTTRRGVYERLEETAKQYEGEQAAIREFRSGATRDSDNGKLDFEGFLSGPVVCAFGEYMHASRFLKDGTVRASDNWQGGMPLDVYMKSAFRHFIDLWMIHRGQKPVRPESDEEVSIDDALGGLLFNVQGYWHETLKAREAAE